MTRADSPGSRASGAPEGAATGGLTVERLVAVDPPREVRVHPRDRLIAFTQESAGARQIFIDELERPSEHVDADLDENAGRILDVVPRGLDEPRGLPKLRKDSARAFRRGGIGEQRLSGEARRQDVRVDLRISLPRTHLFELEHPAARV